MGTPQKKRRNYSPRIPKGLKARIYIVTKKIFCMFCHIVKSNWLKIQKNFERLDLPVELCPIEENPEYYAHRCERVPVLEFPGYPIIEGMNPYLVIDWELLRKYLNRSASKDELFHLVTIERETEGWVGNPDHDYIRESSETKEK